MMMCSFCFSGFRAGYDFSKEADFILDGEKGKENFESGFVFGYDFNGETNINFGFEYVLSTELKDSPPEVDIITSYLSYVANLNQDLDGFFRLGFSIYPNFDDNGFYSTSNDINADFKTDGGLMYGLGINFSNFQIAYSYHEGSIILDISHQEYGNILYQEVEVAFNRITLSYLLNTAL